MATITVIGPEDRERWDETVRSFPDYDVMYLSAYSAAFMKENPASTRAVRPSITISTSGTQGRLLPLTSCAGSWNGKDTMSPSFRTLRISTTR